MQTTWSDLDSEGSAFTTSEDSRYDSNDMLTDSCPIGVSADSCPAGAP